MKICIYCSARNNIDQKYFDDARQLGEALARAGHTLVFGGGSVGLMGELARTYQKEGGRLEGVITDRLVVGEVAFHDCDLMIVKKDMHLRKREMERRADAFIMLPGGIGTLDEFFATITHKHLGHHGAQFLILNTDGYYDDLFELFEKMQAGHFMNATDELFSVHERVDDIIAVVESWSP